MRAKPTAKDAVGPRGPVRALVKLYTSKTLYARKCVIMSAQITALSRRTPMDSAETFGMLEAYLSIMRGAIHGSQGSSSTALACDTSCTTAAEWRGGGFAAQGYHPDPPTFASGEEQGRGPWQLRGRGALGVCPPPPPPELGPRGWAQQNHRRTSEIAQKSDLIHNLCKSASPPGFPSPVLDQFQWEKVMSGPSSLFLRPPSSPRIDTGLQGPRPCKAPQAQ